MISYNEILELYVHGDPEEQIPRIMAEKMYKEIFSYDKMDFGLFIKKLLDDYLDINFSNECKRRNLEIGSTLQNYKRIRNAIIHGKDQLSLKIKEFSVMKLKNLIIEYIRLVEELMYPNYFKKPEVEEHFYFNLDDYDEDDGIF